MVPTFIRLTLALPSALWAHGRYTCAMHGNKPTRTAWVIESWVPRAYGPAHLVTPVTTLMIVTASSTGFWVSTFSIFASISSPRSLEAMSPLSSAS